MKCSNTQDFLFLWSDFSHLSTKTMHMTNDMFHNPRSKSHMVIHLLHSIESYEEEGHASNERDGPQIQQNRYIFIFKLN